MLERESEGAEGEKETPKQTLRWDDDLSRNQGLDA